MLAQISVVIAQVEGEDLVGDRSADIPIRVVGQIERYAECGESADPVMINLA